MIFWRQLVFSRICSHRKYIISQPETDWPDVFLPKKHTVLLLQKAYSFKGKLCAFTSSPVNRRLMGNEMRADSYSQAD